MTNSSDMSATLHTGELDLEQLDAVNGGNAILNFFFGWAGGKALDAVIDAVQEAGPAPKTEHGDVYNVQPAGFIG
jgi:hypothetical protein